MSRTALAVSLALCLSAPLRAEDPSPAPPPKPHPIEVALEKCMNDAKSTADMVACEDEAYRKWDDELNKAYGALMKKLAPKQKEALKASQLAWIAHRDKELAFVSALYDGFEGTMYHPMRVDAAKEVVRRRATELAHYIQILEESGYTK